MASRDASTNPLIFKTSVRKWKQKNGRDRVKK